MSDETEPKCRLVEALPDDDPQPPDPHFLGFQELNEERAKKPEEPVDWAEVIKYALIGMLLNFFLTFVFLAGPIIWIYYCNKLVGENPTHGAGGIR